MEIHLLCSSKKRMSVRHLHRMLGVTYKCACSMAFYGGLSRNVSVSVDGGESFEQKTEELSIGPITMTG